MAKGRFIVIEGIDGSGSTTQAKELVTSLGLAGIAANFTCEPSEGPIGKLIRKQLTRNLLDTRDGQPLTFSWDTMALLFAADRLDHLNKEVLPALEKGVWVVSDRYVFSSLTYQVLTSKLTSNLSLPWIRHLNSMADVPDLTLILGVDYEVAKNRRLSRGGAEELFDKDALQVLLAEAYQNPSKYLGYDYKKIDGNKGVTDIAEAIWDQVQKLIPKENAEKEVVKPPSEDRAYTGNNVAGSYWNGL